MYCSTCGSQIAEHLNYCNACGARIDKNPLIISNASSPNLSRAFTIVGMVGFVGFIAVLKLLLDAGQRLDVGAVVVILLAYLATLGLICGMMVRYMWKHSGDVRIKATETAAEADEYIPPRSFRPVNTSQLSSGQEPAASVTEHTTRTLEEVPLRRH